MITKRQAELLTIIKAFWRDHQRSPSLKEMMAAMGYRHHGGVLRILAVLEHEAEIVVLRPGRKGGLTVEVI